MTHRKVQIADAKYTTFADGPDEYITHPLLYKSIGKTITNNPIIISLINATILIRLCLSDISFSFLSINVIYAA